VPVYGGCGVILWNVGFAVQLNSWSMRWREWWRVRLGNGYVLVKCGLFLDLGGSGYDLYCGTAVGEASGRVGGCSVCL
jgi:hypothetical protein